MYVRWQRRLRKKCGGSPLLTAALVENRRVDGKPRQRVMAYLAGIRERFIGEREKEHRQFWRKIDERLDDLGLDPATRTRIEGSIEARVPRVTDENQAVFAAEAARLGREIVADLAEYRRLASRHRVSTSR